MQFQDWTTVILHGKRNNSKAQAFKIKDFSREGNLVTKPKNHTDYHQKKLEKEDDVASIEKVSLNVRLVVQKAR